MSSSAVLKAANERRIILGLPPIENLDANTSLKDGIASLSPEKSTSKIAKNQAISDINHAKENIKSVSRKDFKETSANLIASINELQINTSGIKNITKESLFNIALAEFDNEQCPVCDTKWDPEKFKSLLQEKTKKLKDAKLKRNKLEDSLKPVIELLRSTQVSIERISRYGIQLVPAIATEEFATYINKFPKKSVSCMKQQSLMN